MREQTAGTIDHRPQLARQWNKCVYCLNKHSLEFDSSLPLTYPRQWVTVGYTLKSGIQCPPQTLEVRARLVM